MNADYYIVLKKGQVVAQGSTTVEMMETGLDDLAEREH